jgi:hypothetical protein
VDAPTTAVFRLHPHVHEPFLEPADTHSPSPAQLHPQPSTLALSLALRARLGSSTVARRGLALVLWSPSSPRRVRCLGKLRLVTHNPRHPSVRPLPHWFAWSALTGSLPQLCRRRPVPSPCPRCRSRVPEPPLKVTVLTPPLFSPVMHLVARDCSPECSPVRRGLSLRRLAASAPFMQTRPRHNACQVIPNLSSYLDRPLAP